MFTKDIFSENVPIWRKLSENRVSIILKILIAGRFYGLNCSENSDIEVEYSGSFEINSNNYKIHFEGNTYILKKWSSSKHPKELSQILTLMTYFNSAEMPVPRAISNNAGSMLCKVNQNYWSLFPYIKGDYFSGNNGQIDVIPKILGEFYFKGLNIPKELTPVKGPSHLTDEDNCLLFKLNQERGNWTDILGEELAFLLSENWNYIWNTWNKLRQGNFLLGSCRPIHFDLHPHNLLVDKNEVTAILDFESFQVFRVGVAIAFNGLKQCRQYISLGDNISDSQKIEIGKKYMDDLVHSFPQASEFRDNFCELAQIEVLRRLCIILRLNFDSHSKVWNNVLPIQIDNLKECTKLFK